MRMIDTTPALAEFCAEAKGHPFVTVDTEFLRERTYYAQLCLVQLAYPGDEETSATLVDTLAPGIDLEPLYDLFRDPNIVKVFHAARQDLEIFCVNADVIPTPLFDTQVAGMVCGFGEQVGYETLVRTICKTSIDKSSRFTDWSRRPLSDKQKNYALADVTHLRDIYLHLANQVAQTGRADWVTEEMAILTNRNTYINQPADSWKRVKTRTNSRRFMAIVRELAEFREGLAQQRNVPRGRIYKDDLILELAATRPANIGDLGRSRLLQREAHKGPVSEGILAGIARAVALDAEDLPDLPPVRSRKPGMDGLADLLRVLLKARASQTQVAQKLIASSADLDDIASGITEGLPAMTGWRHKVFGEDAERLTRGEIALSVNDGGVAIVEI